MVNPDKLKKAELIEELSKHGIPMPTPTTKHLKAVYLDLYKTHITNGAENGNDKDIDFDNLSDNEIKAMLTERGVSIGPIQPSTRQLYLNKLKKLMADGKKTVIDDIVVPEQIEDEEVYAMLQSPVAARETRSASRRRTMILSQPPAAKAEVMPKTEENSFGDAQVQQEVPNEVDTERQSMSVDPSRRSRSVSLQPQVLITGTESSTVRQRSVKPEGITEVVTETSMMTEPEQEEQILETLTQVQPSSAKCSMYLLLSIAIVVGTLLFLCMYLKIDKNDVEKLFKQFTS